MKLISDGKLDLNIIKTALSRPPIFTKSTARFWDDDHIAAQMLTFHLDPDIEAASKTGETIAAEAAFIIKTTGMDARHAVLDLGCGPGLYVREFARTGAAVTGVDLSAVSIAHATATVASETPNSRFVNMNYLCLDFRETFDIATLIFYDFCALDTAEQHTLLAKTRQALKPGGAFIFDILSANWRNTLSPSIAVHAGGFWSPDPYIEIIATFSYREPRTEGVQYTIIAEDGETKIMRLYHRLFALEELTGLLDSHGFKIEKAYLDLQGRAPGKNPETYGIFARKI